MTGCGHALPHPDMDRFALVAGKDLAGFRTPSHASR
jgi:hypothetical protein